MKTLLDLQKRAPLGSLLMLTLFAGALAHSSEGASTDFTLYVANYLAYNGSPYTRNYTIEEFDLVGRPSVFVTNISFTNPILSAPVAVAVDSSANVYVSCQQDNTWIEKFDPWGNNAHVFSAPAGSDPNGMAFDSMGILYLATGAGRSIMTYNPSGAGNVFFSANNADLVGLAFDKAGNLYASDEGNGLILRISPQTNVTTFASPGANPYGLAFDMNGNLYAALRGNGTIVKYPMMIGAGLTSNSTVFANLGAATQPVGLVFDPAGNLYASEYAANQISRIDPMGNVTTFATAGLNGPAFMALQPKPVTMERYVVAGGGGTSSGGMWSVTGTIGQSHAGVMTGEMMSGEMIGVVGGFLGGPVTNFTGSIPTNLIVNGSFEYGAFTNNHGADNSMSLLPGANNILAWTVTGTTGYDLGWIGPNNDLGISAADGNYFLDLTGYHDSVPYDGVSQTVPTAAGQTYSVSFEIGYSPMYDAAGLPAVTVAVSQLPGVAPTTYAFASSGTAPWQTFQFSFTAQGASTGLTFTGSTSNNVHYIGLDNIIMWASTASSGSGIVMGAPSISNGQLQLPFSMGAAGTTYELQQASGVTGPWMAAQSATMTISPDGTMGIFFIPIAGDTQFYRVRSY